MMLYECSVKVANQHFIVLNVDIVYRGIIYVYVCEVMYVCNNIYLFVVDSD